MACNTCGTNPCGCRDVRLPRGPRGFQGEPGPPLTISAVNITTLAPGDQATASFTQSGTFLILNLGIPEGTQGPLGPPGTDGDDAINLFTSLTSFTAQGLNGSSIATVGDTSWMEEGGWLYIEGGGYFYIQYVLSPTTIQLINPGSVLGWPSGIPGNVISSAVVPSASPSQVAQAGVPGLPGAQGVPGTTPNLPDIVVDLVTVIPVAPPLNGQGLQLYTDSLATPTTVQFYSWDGASWLVGPEMIGPQGTKIISTAGDPNSTLPGGLNIGDYALNTVTPGLWLKTGSSTYTLQVLLTNTFQQVAAQSAGDFGTVPVSTQAVMGFVESRDTHTSPGAFTFDLGYQNIYVDADEDIAIDWSAGAYAENAHWIFIVENVGVGAINVTYAVGRWSKATGLTEPAAIAAGVSQAFECYMADGRMVIANTYVIATI